MPIIRQEGLFSINELYAIEPIQRYDAIISLIDIDRQLIKKSRLGALD